jgi:hypothetical protein
MKKIFVLLFLLIVAIGAAQNGISYQAVLLNPNGEQLPGADNSKIPLVNSSICLRFSIAASSGGTPEYQETITTKTDPFGMVNVTIGTGNPTPGSPSFSTISWGTGPKNLKMELDLTGLCTSFITVSDQPFTSVPFALYALNSGSGGGSSTTTLTGDVSGSGTGTVATSIANNVITSTKILDGEISNIDINSSAAIDFTKLNIQKSNILGLGIVKADFGLGNVDNTSDANKPISTAAQTALNAKAPLISPTFTGTIALNGPTTVSGANTFTVETGNTVLGGTLNAGASTLASAVVTNDITVGGKVNVKEIVDSSSNRFDSSGNTEITINSMSGRFKMPTSNTSIKVNNTNVKSNSIILCTITKNIYNSTNYIISVDAFTDYFTLKLSSGPNDLFVNFLIIN